MAKKKETNILSKHQKRVLELIAREDYFAKRFYLAGGTALAEFYLQHRLSEDLDLFCEKQEVNSIPILRFFEQYKKTLGIRKIETSRILGLYTFFLHFHDGEILKVDFNYYPFKRIENGMKFYNLEIESLYDIGVDKVHTIVMKPRARDFIDIYFIIKEKDYSLDELLMQAKAKFDWDITALALGSRFMEASKSTDYPRMLKKIDHREWKEFFANEARKLKKEIFK